MAGGALARGFAAGTALEAGAALATGAGFASARGLAHSKASVKVRQRECSERMFIPQSSRETTMDSDADGQAVRQRETIGSPRWNDTDNGTGDDDTTEHDPFECCWRTEGQYQTVLGLDPRLQQGEKALL